MAPRDHREGSENRRKINSDHTYEACLVISIYHNDWSIVAVVQVAYVTGYLLPSLA